MADFRNEFSWSFSRHKTFLQCRRQYYWNYYGYWDGWTENAPDEARLAYRLKKMVSMPMWIGDLVHRMIERIIGDMRNQETNSLKNYQQQVRKLMNHEWAQSLDKKWQWKPKYNLNLFEHYYGVEITADQRVAAKDKAFRCLEHLMRSSLFGDLERLKPEEWKSVEKLTQFAVGEQPVFVKIDCATMSGDQIAIYDWKTGRETDDTAVQLGCYALYAYQAWHVAPVNQRLVSVYLDPDKITEHVPSAPELIDTKDFILTSMEHMIGALDGPAAENAASVDNFPMTDDRKTCRRCCFRELCFQTRDWPPAAEAS